MSRDGDGLSRDAADAIYDVLVAHFGVREDGRYDFLHSQTTRYCSEYRVHGKGRQGGKFWRSSGWRTDGSYGEVWLVNAYAEDVTPSVQAAIDVTNTVLAVTQAEHDALTA